MRTCQQDCSGERYFVGCIPLRHRHVQLDGCAIALDSWRYGGDFGGRSSCSRFSRDWNNVEDSPAAHVVEIDLLPESLANPLEAVACCEAAQTVPSLRMSRQVPNGNGATDRGLTAAETTGQPCNGVRRGTDSDGLIRCVVLLIGRSHGELVISDRAALPCRFCLCRIFGG
jgi:hypothetical protein